MTNPQPINATVTSALLLKAQPQRKYLLIQNYLSSAQSIYVSFGADATGGTKGEMEIAPGSHFEMGSVSSGIPSELVPPDAVFAITALGVATGMIMEIF